jgi:hypothetical protein
MGWFGFYLTSDADDGTEMMCETSIIFNQLTWLIVEEDFSKYEVKIVFNIGTYTAWNIFLNEDNIVVQSTYFFL